MEKIQSAIAKARAAREGQIPPPAVSPPPAAAVSALAAGPAVTVMPAPAPAPAPAAPEAAATAADPAAVTAAWAALPAFVPNAPLMVRNRIVAFDARSPDAVSFDVMRTRILQQMRANNWRRLAVTSPTAGCGKSMIVLNLGFSLARQTDQRTIVAELDLRRPTLAKTLGLKMPQKFADVLAGTARFEDHAVRHSENLCFATNHAAVGNPAELLGGSTIGPALADIEARYDPALILFDMPPMLVSDDVMAFMGQVDCVLLVAAAETSTIKEIDTCERDLASQTNVMGVILNKCRYVERSYGYGYGSYG